MEWLTTLGDSSFFTTVFGALAGAFAGAWAAQRIAERSKLREELKKEISNINAAIMLAYTTSNQAMVLKKQHVRELKKSYDADCVRHKVHVQKAASGQAVGAFELVGNFLNFQVLSPPITHLEDIVMGRLSTAGRTLVSMSALSDAIGNLNYAISKRNDLMERMQHGDLPEGAGIEHFYLGIPYAEGRRNQEYGSYINAMALYTDDAIFFGFKLCEDLQAHGARLSRKHKKKFGGEAPRIVEIDLTQAEDEGLLPKDDNYVSWLSGFRPAEEVTLRWWQWFKKASQYIARKRKK
jgi:gas vesicle protein